MAQRQAQDLDFTPRITAWLALFVLTACQTTTELPARPQRHEGDGPLVDIHGIAGNLPGGQEAIGRADSVQPAVTTAAAGDARAGVIATLHDDGDDGEDGANPVSDALRYSRVQRLQDRVLSALAPGDLVVTRRYQWVAALAGRATPAGLAKLRVLPEVSTVQDDLDMHADVLPATLVQAAQAHAKLGLTGKGVRVAIVDTGVDLEHPDLAGRVVAQHCFAQSGCPQAKTEGPNAQDANGHGTHVASLVAGAGQVAPPGMAPDARLVVVRVLGKTGSGPTSDVLAGLDWLAQHAPGLGIRLVNLSLGGKQAYAGTCDGADPATAKAVQLLRKRGVAVFAAAGNGAVVGGLSSPACLTGVTSVGASYTASYGKQQFPGLCKDAKTGTTHMACFSNRSTALDLVAPGAFLTGAGLGGGTAVMAGTSQATPIAVGVAALILGCQPKLKPDALQAVLQKSGKPVTDPASGQVFPMVQAVAAAKTACP